MNKEFAAKIKLARSAFICFAVLFMIFFVTEKSFAFDFSEDVAARFFWTKAYKDKHPKPKNNMPKTMAEYYKEANKRAVQAQDIPAPRYVKDEKLVDVPDPDLSLKKYNNPPGTIDINLNDLKKKRQINSIGVVSPTHDKLAYSTIYYFPSTQTTGSELHLMKLDTTKGLQSRVETAHVNQGKRTVYRTGMNSLELHVQKTLTIVDWSDDGKRLAIKEKIAFEADGLWKTNLLVYNLQNGTMKNLSEVRDAIQYYWREKQGLHLKDYRWDIYPMGWDSLNPDRVIVYAYAFTGEKPKFLGAWSIDYNGERAMLLSLVDTELHVTQNGLSIKPVYNDF